MRAWQQIITFSTLQSLHQDTLKWAGGREGDGLALRPPPRCSVTSLALRPPPRCSVTSLALRPPPRCSSLAWLSDHHQGVPSLAWLSGYHQGVPSLACLQDHHQGVRHQPGSQATTKVFRHQPGSQATTKVFVTSLALIPPPRCLSPPVQTVRGLENETYIAQSSSTIEWDVLMWRSQLRFNRVTLPTCTRPVSHGERQPINPAL